jgi:hypothetical protein
MKEIPVDEYSDEELEERDEVMEPCVQSSSSSEDESYTAEIAVTFRATRAGICRMSWILLDLQMASMKQLPPI